MQLGRTARSPFFSISASSICALALLANCGPTKTVTATSGSTGGTAGTTGGSSTGGGTGGTVSTTGGSTGGSTGGAAAQPAIAYTDPQDAETGVATKQDIIVTFEGPMSGGSFSTANFVVDSNDQGALDGTVSYNSSLNLAIFHPAAPLSPNTEFTATLGPGVTDATAKPLPQATWYFTTGTGPAAGPAPVLLGSAGSYVILASSAISNVTGSQVTGDLGLSPAAASYITGFALIADATNTFATSSSVVGKVYAADYAPPTPSITGIAIGAMQTAYTDAAGRVTPDHSELSSGSIGGLTLYPGLYKWTNTVSIDTDVTISGGANDVWVFQISGDLLLSAAKSVILSPNADAGNIFWQVAGQATFGANSHFNGIVLSQTAATLQTGASMNGRLLAQTAVSIDNCAVTQP